MNRSPIIVKQGNRSKVLTESSITYVESRGRVQIVHTRDGGSRVMSKTMNELEETLRGGFFRIHRCFLVNMDCIDIFERTQVKLQDGSSLLMSKYKYHEFVDSYLKYMSGKP